MLEWHVLFLMEFMISKPFSFKFCCIVSIFLGICAIFLYEKCVVLRKLACPFRLVQIKMYSPKSRFFKNSHAGASRPILMSNPGKLHFHGPPITKEILWYGNKISTSGYVHLKSSKVNQVKFLLFEI